MSKIYHYKFSPWTVKGDRHIIASEAMWKKPAKWEREAEMCKAIGPHSARRQACRSGLKVGASGDVSPLIWEAKYDLLT